MKENKPPLFVKLFMPQTDKIDESELISTWGKPHPKEFHVIDNPSIINRIATEMNQNRRQYNSAKTATQPSQSPGGKKPVYIVKKTKKSIERIKYSKLNQEVNCLSDFIESEVTQLNVSEIFQYKQKMLTTFLQNFFEQLELECHEKASFIKQIWNQTIGLFDRIFEKQSENSLNHEKGFLNEIMGLHKNYQEMFEKLKNQKIAVTKQSEKFKEIIKSLVRNIKERQKEIKVYKGGIDDYNTKLNNLSAQFIELKREHIDILMYGHEGSMTKQEAEEMLARILQPDDEDEAEPKDFLTIKYTPPKLTRGKSQRFIKFSEDSLPEVIDSFQTPDQIKEYTLSVTPVNVELKHNFVPKKMKYKDHTKGVDTFAQTDEIEHPILKIDESTDCNYFTRMEETMIKNKYCQTEIIKKIININGFCQTEISGGDPFVAQKKAKLKITGNLYDANLRNPEKRMKNTEKFNTTLTFLKTQNEIAPYSEQDQECLESDEQIFQRSKDKRTTIQPETLEKLKQDRKSQKNKKGSIYSKKLSQARQHSKGSKLSIANSAKMRTKTKPEEIIVRDPHRAQSYVKVQNFVKLNKMRASNQLKTRIAQFFSGNNKNVLPQVALLQRNAGLLRCYFEINQKDLEDEETVRQSIDCEDKEQFIQTHREVFLFQNWSNKLVKTFSRITHHPTQRELDIAIYFNTKKGKNKNLAIQNKDYLDQLNPPSDSKGSTPMKTDSYPTSGQFQTFTLKKAYKIIEQVFELCLKIRESKEFLNINFIEILEKLFSPTALTTLNGSVVESPRKPIFSIKIIEFLKYLMRNMNENYLIKNFLFLCGINSKTSESKEKQTGIVNINKTTHIKEKQDLSKKAVYIQTAIKHQMIEKQKKDAQKQNYGTLVYSSEVSFYLDMFKAMNCYSNSMTDIANSYTTLEMLQVQFEKIPKHYKDEKLIKKIKGVIDDSLRTSSLSSSKLNIFKCLQIFLEKVRERKIQMMNSYQGLYNSLKESQKINTNHYLLAQILNLLKAPLETQLKIIAKLFKKCEYQSSFEDLMTFFIMEGFPDVQLLQQGLVKSAKNAQLGKMPSFQKLNSCVLEYFKFGRERKSTARSRKYLNEMNGSVKMDETLDKEIEQIIGHDLSRMNIAHIFLVSKE